LTKCIAFHSYKGGTGKTTIGANFAASLTKEGYKVSLIDLDVYAPSLQSYFDVEPEKSINDYLYSNAEVEDVMVDMTSLVNNSFSNVTGSHKPGLEPKDPSNSKTEKGSPYSVPDTTSSSGVGSQRSNSDSFERSKKSGKLWVGFCSTRKEDIFKLEGGVNENMRRQFLKRFILLREQLISSYDSDYIIIDTSPGIRYWSINALAVADILFLTLKMGDLDIEGTKKIVDEIYTSFTKFGTRSFLLLNRVSGYCVPHTLPQYSGGSETHATGQFSDSDVFSTFEFLPKGTRDKSIPTRNVKTESGSGGHLGLNANISSQMPANHTDLSKMLSEELRMNVISSVPCYCDIQFVRKEFLTALQFPEHPFAIKIQELINNMERLAQR
jgi:MinD-like ATPase involved in chromosome partitioning or flagellar assembly